MSRLAKDSKLSWMVRYSLACIVLIVAFIGIFRHVLGLDVLEYTSQIGIVALGGIVGVIALSVALMGAAFYSSRSGVDDAVRDAHEVGTRSFSNLRHADDREVTRAHRHNDGYDNVANAGPKH